MEKYKIPILILVGAVVLGSSILMKTGAPKANAQLTETYKAIPTKSGQALFLTQSANLTKNVDPLLVDLDSQIVTCNPNVDSLLSSAPVAGGSCVAGESTLAKYWIDYDHATTLTPSEQRAMDQAMHLSKEGPCCCKCWHYYVNEGIAKKMIRDYHYTAAQVAAYWDTSSIC